MFLRGRRVWEDGRSLMRHEQAFAPGVGVGGLEEQGCVVRRWVSICRWGAGSAMDHKVYSNTRPRKNTMFTSSRLVGEEDSCRIGPSHTNVLANCISSWVTRVRQTWISRDNYHINEAVNLYEEWGDMAKSDQDTYPNSFRPPMEIVLGGVQYCNLRDPSIRIGELSPACNTRALVAYSFRQCRLLQCIPYV